MGSNFKLVEALNGGEGGYIRWELPRDSSDFKHLPTVAFSKYFLKCSDFGRVSDFVSQDWVDFQSKYPADAFSIKEKSTYRGRARDFEAIMKSIRKADVEVKCPPRDENFLLAIQYTTAYLKPHLLVRPTISFPLAEFNMKALPGEPYEAAKIKTKRDAFFSKMFLDRYKNRKIIPYFKCFPKRELLPEEDIVKPINPDEEDSNKIRTIFNPPLDFLAECAELFDQQNDLLINAAGKIWSCYGTNKWMGGFDRMFKKLQKFSGREERDLSGYDRVALLFIVYQIRHNLLDLTPEQEASFWWCYWFICHSFVTTPLGKLLLFMFGNRSGSRSTASDNTILHIFMRIYALIDLYVKKFNKCPELHELISHHEALIYSDDVTSSVDLEFFQITMEEWMEHLSYCYSLFGMVSKVKTIKYTIGTGLVSDVHSFLGSHVRYSQKYKMYYPVPNIGKIVSSAIYTTERKQVVFTISRIMALITMVALDHDNEDVYIALCKYLRYLVQQHLEEIPNEVRGEVIQFTGLCDDPSYFIYHYFGLEGNLNSFRAPEFLIFFNSIQCAELKDAALQSVYFNNNNCVVTSNGVLTLQSYNFQDGGGINFYTCMGDVNTNKNKGAQQSSTLLSRKKSPAARRRQRQRRRAKRAYANKALPPVPRPKPWARSEVLSGQGDYTKKDKKKVKKQIKKQLIKQQKKADESQWYNKIFDLGAEWIPKLAPMLIGMGDYGDMDPDSTIVHAPEPEMNSITAAATEGVIGGLVPDMHKVGDKARIVFKEFLGDIYSTTSAFAMFTLPINPGMNETFPWLSFVANNYTNYRILGMCFYFKTESSDYSATMNLGYVAMSTQYNVNELDFVDKRTMLNYEFSSSGKPSDNQIHCIECKPSDLITPVKTVRSGTVEGNQDLRLYDWGKLTVAAGGNPVNVAQIGELWVTYDIEFFLPKSVDAGGQNIGYSRGGTSTGVVFGTPLGTAAHGFSGRSTFQYTNDTTTISMPTKIRGLFVLIIEWVGTGAVTFQRPSYTLTNLVEDQSIFPVRAAPNELAQLVTSSMLHICFQCNQDGGLITLGTAGVIPTTASVNVIFMQIPRNDNVDVPIFDRQGKNYLKRYQKFQESIGINPVFQPNIKKAERYFATKESEPKHFSSLVSLPAIHNSEKLYDTDNFELWQNKDTKMALYRDKEFGTTDFLTSTQLMVIKRMKSLKDVDAFLLQNMNSIEDSSSTDSFNKK